MSEPSPLPIPAASLPAHIAIIMDGNGRWAQERGLSRSEGHKAGVRAAKAIVTECRTLGIRHLTLYTFSQENWGRPKDEVSLLFQLLVSFLGEELPSMERNGISLRVFGDLDGLPLPARTALRHAMNRTAKCSDMIVNLALNYSGREEILRAARLLMQQGVKPEAVTEETFQLVWAACSVPVSAGVSVSSVEGLPPQPVRTAASISAARSRDKHFFMFPFLFSC